jgi:hypothetical protein
MEAEMSYKGTDQTKLPELESVRRLRESQEGGPGSGRRPYGGGQTKTKKQHTRLQMLNFLSQRANEHPHDDDQDHGRALQRKFGVSAAKANAMLRKWQSY